LRARRRKGMPVSRVHGSAGAYELVSTRFRGKRCNKTGSINKKKKKKRKKTDKRARKGPCRNPSVNPGEKSRMSKRRQRTGASEEVLRQAQQAQDK